MYRSEIEDGTVIAATDTAAATEAGASPNVMANNCHETTFATVPAFWGRSLINLDDVTADFEDNFGRYFVMWRGKTDAGTECNVRVDFVLAGTDTLLTGDLFTVDSGGDWCVKETGLIVTLPPAAGKTRLDVPETYGFEIAASREAGAGSLFTDCILLIPIDEYFVKYEWPETGLVAAPTNPFLQIAVGPDDTEAALLSDVTGDGPRDTTPPIIEGPGIPIGDCYAYFITTEDLVGTHSIGGTIDVDVYMNWRYHSLRGAG